MITVPPMSGVYPGSGTLPWLFGIPLVAAVFAYLACAVALRRRGGWWPAGLIVCWLAGVAAAGAALIGPIADAAHHDFAAHMVGHLLLGMTAPLLLVLAAPVTLALRVLPVARARTLSKALGSRPVELVTHPVTAAVLNAGGLWLLYTTDLYRAMTSHAWVHLVVHAHILAAGYLFTAAMIGVDPAPHRPRRGTRTAVLILFLAAHAVLAKYLYGHPPAGVPTGDSRTGAQLMYYGGELIDVTLIVIFCRQWYQATDPDRRASSAAPRIATTPPPKRQWRLPEEMRTAPRQ